MQQILAFSRERPDSAHAHYVARAGHGSVSVAPGLAAVRRSIRTHLAEDAGAVLADATQHCIQVLLNLCTNAAYAMRMTGGVLEEVQLEAVESRRPWP